MVFHPCGPEEEQFRRFQFCGHISEFELNRLEGDYGFTKLHPFLGVIQGILQSSLANAAGLGTDADAARIQTGEHLPETLTGFPQDVFHRHFRVFKNQLRRS